MALFRPEPPHLPGRERRVGVLLVNLGSPAAPTAAALRPWLRQFLSDPRVVELPRPWWWFILNGLILPTRPARSARKYAQIWTDEGSPLIGHTRRQAEALRAAIKDENIDIAWAMRYGAPDIAATLDALRARCGRLLVVPLYPQFAASTTASTMDAVARAMMSWRDLPALRYVRDFHDDPGYIAALAARVRAHWCAHGQGDCLVMSFHGLPQDAAERGDPYPAECRASARLLQDALELADDRVKVTFQSRFGRSAWLQPYTQPTIEALAMAGTRRVEVICPGFAADCLETLEEIAMTCRDAFIHHGGETFHALACLNTDPAWIDALAGIIDRHLAGWV
ncbi:MAG: ferrochelatase [Azoarcus sp.]|jgi:ferrochelatase|nr:ferrochelatase [Azoarcus sp.]